MPRDTGQHVVITVHGIRTFGAWQRRLERLIAPASKDVRFYHFEYGYFSLLAFIIPFTRWLVVRRFQRELRSIFGRVKPSRLDLVAHSFGTHLVGWALRGLSSEEDIRVHTVILSGSVLRSDFYWADLVPTRVQRVINDCGSKDSVLLASQFLVLFTGMAGRVGFIGMNGPEFSNRYSNFGHGGYFQDPAGQSSDAYMTKYWVPAISGTDDIVPLDERNARRSSRRGLVHPDQSPNLEHSARGNGRWLAFESDRGGWEGLRDRETPQALDYLGTVDALAWIQGGGGYRCDLSRGAERDPAGRAD